MTTLYKLTDSDGFTRAGQPNALQWAVGVTHVAKGEGTELCTDGVLHAYEHPLLAVLLNRIHANFNPTTMRLWRCVGEIVAREGQLKCGVKSLTVLEEMTVPTLTTEQRIRFAILCVKEVCEDVEWNAWADKWLSGEDRSEAAARAAASATTMAAAAAAAAWAAAWVAAAAWAAAAWVEASWVAAAADIDLISIARKAIQ